MVTVTSNPRVRVSKKFFEKMVNGLLAVIISGSPVVGVRWKAVKKYYLKSCYYLDEVWLTTYLISP